MEKEKTKKPVYKRWWFWAISGFLFICFLGALGSDSTQTPDSSSVSSLSTDIAAAEPESPPVVEEPVATTTAIKFYNDYTSNNLAAEQKYNDHLVKLTGVIKSIGRDILSKPYIVLMADEYGIYGIQCMVNDGALTRVTEVSIGDTVTMVGRVADNAIGSIILKDCSIE